MAACTSFAASSLSKTLIPEVEAYCFKTAISQPQAMGCYLDIVLARPEISGFLTGLRGSATIGIGEKAVIGFARRWYGRIERKAVSTAVCDELEVKTHSQKAMHTTATLGFGLYRKVAATAGKAGLRTPIAATSALLPRAPASPALKPGQPAFRPRTLPLYAPGYTTRVQALFTLFSQSANLPAFRKAA